MCNVAADDDDDDDDDVDEDVAEEAIGAGIVLSTETHVFFFCFHFVYHEHYFVCFHFGNVKIASSSCHVICSVQIKRPNGMVV